MPTIPAFTFLPAVYGASVGLAATGLALLIARAFDVITDPLIGAFSDRTSSRWGRRKPWILVGAILSGYAILRLAQPPAQPTAIYLAIWSSLLFVGWTLVQVPYTTWGAELSEDYYQRARITAAREGMAVVGIVAAGAVPLFAAQSGRSEQDAFMIIAWLAVILGGPSILYMLWRVPDPLPPSSLKPARTSLRDTVTSIRDLLRNRPFARLLTAWFLSGLANGIPASLFLIYLEHVLKADQAQRGILIPIYFVTAIAAIPLWLFVSKHIGKHRAWCMAMILTCAGFIWVPLLSPGDVVAFGIISAITGMGFGADVTLPPALQADVVDYDTWRHRKQRAGLLFALCSMSSKLSLAVAVGTVFPALEMFGFTPRGDNTPDTLLIVAVIYALIPVALKIISIALVWNFPITAKRQARIRKRLDARAARVAA